MTSSLSRIYGLLPQEEMLEQTIEKKSLTIGIPKELKEDENRIVLTPKAVEQLTINGNCVIFEKGAGKRSNYSDEEYQKSGAIITNNVADVFNSDIILKITPPTKHEISFLNKNQLVFSHIDIAKQTASQINSLLNNKCNLIALEFMKNENNRFPIVDLLSEINGSNSILIASEYLSNNNGGKGIILGGITGITPTEVMVLGAGITGEFAARTALGLGANVRIFDNDIDRLRDLRRALGQELTTSVFHQKVIEEKIQYADVVIGAFSTFSQENDCMVPEEFVKKMKPGTVIVDLNILQGGCFETSCETSFAKPTFTKHGVIHYCVPNLASRVSRTACIAYSNVMVPLLLKMSQLGGIKQLLQEDIGVRRGVCVYKGILTNKCVGNFLNLNSRDIDLLMAAF